MPTEVTQAWRGSRMCSEKGGTAWPCIRAGFISDPSVGVQMWRAKLFATLGYVGMPQHYTALPRYYPFPSQDLCLRHSEALYETVLGLVPNPCCIPAAGQNTQAALVGPRHCLDSVAELYIKGARSVKGLSGRYWSHLLLTAQKRSNLQIPMGRLHAFRCNIADQ